MLEELKKLAIGLITPQVRSQTLAFQTTLSDVWQKGRDGPDHLRVRAAAATIDVYVRAMVDIRADAVKKSAHSLSARFTDRELQGVFDDLLPSFVEVRDFVFEQIRGLQIPGTYEITSAVQNAYDDSRELACGELSLSAAQLSGTMSADATVFVSCGQSTGEERSIGTSIVSLIDKHTDCTGYFAHIL